MAAPLAPAGNDRRWKFWGAVVFLVGATLQVLFWRRAVWMYRDQVELYTLGMDLVQSHALAPFGKLMTGDIPIPGAALQLLIGLPLLVWRDYRAASLLLGVVHLLAGTLLTRVFARDFGWRWTTLFLLLFWLSPWRLYHSGFVWEASYMFLPAAVHLWACRTQNEQARPLPSLVLGLTLLLAAQVHGSFLVLAVATAILVWRRRVRLHVGGCIAGTLLGGVTLLPTVVALLAGARPTGAALPGLSIGERLNSLQKAIQYCFRLSSLDVGRRFRETLFCRGIEGGAGHAGPAAACWLLDLTEALALASVLLSVLACWHYFRRAGGAGRGATADWYRRYVAALGLAALVAAVLSPVLLQGWHLLVLMPAACLPLADWTATRGNDLPPWLKALLIITVAWRLPASLLLAFGHPMYATPAPPDLPLHLVPENLWPLVAALSHG